jgi:hypothetical protein
VDPIRFDLPGWDYSTDQNCLTTKLDIVRSYDITIKRFQNKYANSWETIIIETPIDNGHWMMARFKYGEGDFPTVILIGNNANSRASALAVDPANFTVIQTIALMKILDAFEEVTSLNKSEDIVNA